MWVSGDAGFFIYTKSKAILSVRWRISQVPGSIKDPSNLGTTAWSAKNWEDVAIITKNNGAFVFLPPVTDLLTSHSPSRSSCYCLLSVLQSRIRVSCKLGWCPLAPINTNLEELGPLMRSMRSCDEKKGRSHGTWTCSKIWRTQYTFFWLKAWNNKRNVSNL